MHCIGRQKSNVLTRTVGDLPPGKHYVLLSSIKPNINGPLRRLINTERHNTKTQQMLIDGYVYFYCMVVSKLL